MRNHSPILRMGTYLTSLIMGVTTVFSECYKGLTIHINAIVCPLCNSWHLLSTCHTCLAPRVEVALVADPLKRFSLMWYMIDSTWQTLQSLQHVHYDHATNVEFSPKFSPLQVGVLILVRVFLQFTGGWEDIIIISLLLYHPRDDRMRTAPAPSYNITLHHWWKIQSRLSRDKLEVYMAQSIQQKADATPLK